MERFWNIAAVAGEQSELKRAAVHSRVAKQYRAQRFVLQPSKVPQAAAEAADGKHTARKHDDAIAQRERDFTHQRGVPLRQFEQ